MRILMGISAIMFIATIAVIGCGSNGGASKNDAYRKTHESARRALPMAVELEKLFPVADHFITDYGSRATKENVWNTVVYFAGRYELCMQVNVAVDYGNCKISAVGEPVFYLWEVKRVDGSGGAEIGRNFKFSADDWKTVYENGGDFSAIGIQLERDPVARFEDYVAQWRRPRIRISLMGANEVP